jgi:hypothetical protein
MGLKRCVGVRDDSGKWLQRSTIVNTAKIREPWIGRIGTRLLTAPPLFDELCLEEVSVARCFARRDTLRLIFVSRCKCLWSAFSAVGLSLKRDLVLVWLGRRLWFGRCAGLSIVSSRFSPGTSSTGTTP